MPYIIFIFVFLIILIFTLTAKARAYKKSINKLLKEKNKLELKNASLENDHLTFQMQPHTLNNILANLTLNAKKLHNGMDALSDTLDYILYRGKAHLVSVEDEIAFIKKYLALNDLFISEIDSIKLDTSKVNNTSRKYSTPTIPHLISAYFIENAFKHGDVNHPDFLKINLKLSDAIFEMTVINRIKNKPVESKKGGLGLKNMKKRLELLIPDRYEIKNSCNEQEYYSTLIIRFKNGKTENSNS